MPTSASTNSAVGGGKTVTVATTSTTLLSGNTGYVGVALFNSGSVTVYVGLGFVPTISTYTVAISAGGYYEVPFSFDGMINGITSSASGQIQVTAVFPAAYVVNLA